MGALRTDQSRDEGTAGDVAVPGGYGEGKGDREGDRGAGVDLGEKGFEGGRSEAGHVEDSAGVREVVRREEGWGTGGGRVPVRGGERGKRVRGSDHERGGQ